VFWGDQTFLPSVPFAVQPTHHVDILCTLLGDTAPTAEEWTAQGLEKYGVIAVMDGDEAAQVEKVSHADATALLKALGTIHQVGPSLGSFSVSAPFLQALIDEYKSELTAKDSKLDTDPHFWMPLTLPEESYVSLMKKKGTDEAVSKRHYDRMAAMKASFMAKDGNATSMGLFGAVNVGKDAEWWDYGQLKLYSANCRLLLEEGPSADLLREFLGISGGDRQVASRVADASVDASSYVFSSKLGGGTVKESILAGVSASSVDCNGALVVNCAARKIRAGKGSIVYNVIDSHHGEIVVGDGEVVVSVMDETGKSFLLKSRMDIDGGKAWKQKLEMNDLSFEEVHEQNQNANIIEISRKRQANYQGVVDSLGL
jgi:hypothetical protein